MSEPPDLDALAKQYLDLWQQQLGGVSEDQQTAKIMAQTMELMNAGAAAIASMATQNPGNQNQGNADADASSSPSTAAGGAAPGASDLDLAELAQRLERLEKRLDSLETGTKKSRRKPAKKPRKG